MAGKHRAYRRAAISRLNSMLPVALELLEDEGQSNAAAGINQRSG